MKACQHCLKMNVYFFDNNGYIILERQYNHQAKPDLQNSLEVAAEENPSLDLRPYGRGDIGVKILNTPL